MSIKIHVMHTGRVCVSPNLPYGGADCSPIKASGVFGKIEDRLWIPVSVYLIEHPKGLILFDTGWHRDMSPDGVYDEKAQIASLGSRVLYKMNQGVLPQGAAVNEQLAARGIAPEDLDYVLLSHLDCDHANGLRLVAGAKHIMVSRDELESTAKNIEARIRYNSAWWEGCDLQAYEWNGTEGAADKSYDLFGDGSVVCIDIPGHADGQVALKVTGADGRFVLLFADGGYSEKSWRDLVVSGIANNRAQQRASLEWIRAQSLDPACIESLANHDPAIKPHTIELA